MCFKPRFCCFCIAYIPLKVYRKRVQNSKNVEPLHFEVCGSNSVANFCCQYTNIMFTYFNHSATIFQRFVLKKQEKVKNIYIIFRTVSSPPSRPLWLIFMPYSSKQPHLLMLSNFVYPNCATKTMTNKNLRFLHTFIYWSHSFIYFSLRNSSVKSEKPR